MILNRRDWMTVDSKIRLLKSRADYLRRRFANPGEAMDARVEVERIEHRILELKDMKSKYCQLLDRSSFIAMPTSLNELPDFLIRRRIRSGLTQQDLADRLGISRQTIVNYEKTSYSRANLNNILQIDSVLRQMEASPAPDESESYERATTNSQATQR